MHLGKNRRIKTRHCFLRIALHQFVASSNTVRNKEFSSTRNFTVMFTCIFRVKIVLLFLWAILHTSNCVPYPGYIGAITWNWDDSGSGNEEPEDPAPPPQHVAEPYQFFLLAPSVFAVSHERRLPPSERGKSCNFDQNCEKKQFCHEYYKYCQKKKHVGEKCRRTENCDFGLICMWGECKKEATPGVFHSICKQHADCNEGLCCARERGEKVCKPYLREGQNCSVPMGSLGYNYQHECSCGYGLVCQIYGRTKGKNSNPLMKCVKLIA